MDILVLEDVRSDFLLLRRYLSQRGLDARFYWASNWEEVEAALTAQPWQVILSDYHVPGVRFTDLLSLIQARQPDVPVILVTGSVGEELAVDLLKQGVWDFVLKDNLVRFVPIIERSLREAGERVARRRAEASLRLVNAAMRAADNAVMITAPDGAIEWVNRAFTAQTGYTLDEVRGQNPRIFRSGVEPAETYAALWSTLLGGRTWRGELVNRRKDGTTYHDEMTITPVRDDAGVLRHFVAVRADISERKAMEAALLESQQALQAHKDHLEEVVAARTAEAERLSRVKSEFLANMSHEIRTPLNAMLGMAQVGRRRTEGPSERATFDRILESGHHLLGVLDDILDFSKIDAGKMRLDPGIVDLPRLLVGAVDMMAEHACAGGLDLRLEIDPALPRWIAGDSLRISQIVVNLLSNGVKFTERGRVILSAAREDRSLVIRVADTGLGMTEAQVARMFQPFEQADSTTTRRFGGTGLGLAITRKLVELMHGTIAATSALHEGTTFTLHLPLVEAAPPAPDPAPAPDRPRSAEVAPEARLLGVRLLAAEDNEANLFLLGEMLTMEGARLTLAAHGAAAFAVLEAAGEAAFDLVLTDIQMPVMDGHTLARKIRAFAPTLPVVGLTAHAMDEERRRCEASGMAAHVSKPIDLDELVATIRRHARATPPAP